MPTVQITRDIKIAFEGTRVKTFKKDDVIDASPAEAAQLLDIEAGKIKKNNKPVEKKAEEKPSKKKK